MLTCPEKILLQDAIKQADPAGLLGPGSRPAPIHATGGPAREAAVVPGPGPSAGAVPLPGGLADAAAAAALGRGGVQLQGAVHAAAGVPRRAVRAGAAAQGADRRQQGDHEVQGHVAHGARRPTDAAGVRSRAGREGPRRGRVGAPHPRPEPLVPRVGGEVARPAGILSFSPPSLPYLPDL